MQELDHETCETLESPWYPDSRADLDECSSRGMDVYL